MRQRRIQILAMASVMWVLSSAAADPPKGFPAPFKINIHVTAKGDELFDNWDQPTGKDFSVDSISVAPRGKFLSAVILFRACKPDSSGTCNAVVDIVAYDPSGKIYGEMRRAELWQQSPPPNLVTPSSVEHIWASSSSLVIRLERTELLRWPAI
jgi:hypothetical protein